MKLTDLNEDKKPSLEKIKKYIFYYRKQYCKN